MKGAALVCKLIAVRGRLGSTACDNAAAWADTPRAKGPVAARAKVSKNKKRARRICMTGFLPATVADSSHNCPMAIKFW